MPLSPDEQTPICELCGEHIGLMTDCVALMRGQFFWFAEDQYAPMLLERDTDFETVAFDSGDGEKPQKALVMNHQEMGDLAVVHRACLLERFDEDDEDDEDEDEDDDLDDLDRQMKKALERDEFAEDYEVDHYFSRR